LSAFFYFVNEWFTGRRQSVVVKVNRQLTVSWWCCNTFLLNFRL